MYILPRVYQSPFIGISSRYNDNDVIYNSLPYNYMSNILQVFVINHDFPHSKNNIWNDASTFPKFYIDFKVVDVD